VRGNVTPLRARPIVGTEFKTAPPEQTDVCKRFDASVTAVERNDIVCVALATLGETPLYGMRLLPIEGTTGWFFYAGEGSDDEDFYQPLLVSDLITLLPEVWQFLALPPGFQFILDDRGVADVWRDASLLAHPIG